MLIFSLRKKLRARPLACLLALTVRKERLRGAIGCRERVFRLQQPRRLENRSFQYFLEVTSS